MSGHSHFLLARRVGSIGLDLCIEFGGGLLGSYFGAMVAGLVTALRHHDPLMMQSSVSRGFGFGFVFCTLSISFVNRVLIQGISRASLGKRFFNLELVSGTPFTWPLILKRWLLSELSMALGGVGYVWMFLNPEAKALHDLILKTDVVPAFRNNYALAAEYHDERESFPIPQYAAKIIVLTNEAAERPMASVIRLPVTFKGSEQGGSVVASGGQTPTLAQVLELRPDSEQEADQEQGASVEGQQDKIKEELKKAS